ncbi:kinesin motor domain-domain-containing protein [Naematelia encephala]|uniref:Kinesin motor domain-domain-containing protein n=1 Tax=Naematelia encephala TaxID=71784 RepID=A0A1Y2BFK6_9TREE|nr:kinesin motor domain-domain-containing protein [Naematelia encephala]
MSISPTKNRTLSRQPSSPSLAIGLPPPIPDGGMMHPSRSSSNLKSHRSQPRLYRGDVSSSAASSADGSEDDLDKPGATFKSPISPGADTTPKRKVVAMMEPFTAPRSAKKRDTLQARLEQAARVKKSKSASDALNASTSLTNFSTSLASSSLAQSQSRLRETTSNTSSGGSDKVVVCVRIKPTKSAFASSAYEVTPISLTLSDAHPNVQKRGGKAGREDEYTYTFDKLIQYPSTTPELYNAKVSALVDKAMNGFNSTIFAYGQTGSGKSFTMTGTDAELGIIPCAVDGVFDAITAEADRAYLLRVSYIEIYNETLRDLLNFKKGPLKDDEKPAIHTSKGKVYVEPLVEEIVSTPREIIDLLEKGNAGRRVGTTDWNERSSRSHVVFTLVIESRPRDGSGDDDIRLSRLNLIDLAGSERAVSDLERRGEGKHINQSLLALREVINKLTEKKRTHIPYRNSKLTHLLENALGGDSNICVICTMSGDEEHHAETLETLKFAGRCSQVETKATKNIITSSEKALIKAKDREIEELKQRLQGMSQSVDIRPEASQDISELADSVASMEARKSKLSEKLAKLNAEILTSELPRMGAGLPLSPPRRKRPRISDFTSLAGPGVIGLGSPKQIVQDRRAVSGMVRLSEEEDMPSIVGTLQTVQEVDIRAFDHDRLVASLRRTMAAREEELASANRELSDALSRLAQLSQAETEVRALNARLEEQETSARDSQAQLEATRNELVATIDDKATKIDQLESAILDLRKSREDLAIDDQNRYDEVSGKLSRAIEESTALQAERDGLQNQAKESEMRLQNMQAEVEAARLTTQEAERSRDDTHARQKELEGVVATLRTQVAALEETKTEQANQIASNTAEIEAANRDKQTALDDLARFQRESMQHESQVVAELREELAKLRKGREEDAEQAKKEIETSKARSEHLEAECAKEAAQVGEERSRAEAAEARIGMSEAAISTTALRVDALLTEVQIKTDELKKRTDEQEKVNCQLEASLGEKTAAQQKLEASEDEKSVLQRRLEASEDEKTGLEQRLKTSDERVRAVESQLETMRKSADDTGGRAKHLEDEISTLATALDHAKQDNSTLEAQLGEQQDRALASEAKVREFEQGAAALMSKVEQLQGVSRDRLAEADELRSALEAVSNDKQSLEAEVASLRAAAGRIQQVDANLHSTRLELQEAKHKSEALQHQVVVETERANQLVQQLNASRDEAEKTAHLDAELIEVRATVEAEKELCNKLGKELFTAKASAVMEKERADKLAAELVAIKALPSSASTSTLNARQRHSTPTPFGDRNASVKELRLQTTEAESMNQLWTKEMEEIERLEKVVEEQKVIIDEQRGKIKFWADELERQREIVRQLTTDPAAFFGSNSPNNRQSPRISHGKSKSLSVADQLASPLARPSIPSRLPSTFTAHNLALPTSPTPLPMHPSQFDVRGSRKTRRVTIEKDMDRLTDSSKVLKTKALFDIADTSPQKTPTKMSVRPENVPYSAPRQRKP